LKYKKAIKAPSQRAMKIDRGVSKIEADRTQKPKRAIIKSPPAKPSIPSVIFTALAILMIKKAARGMYQ